MSTHKANISYITGTEDKVASQPLDAYVLEGTPDDKQSHRTLHNQQIKQEMQIEELHREQMELREHEDLYRPLFENMINGFAYCRMAFDNDTPSDFTYLAVNKSFEQLTGLHDVVGRNVTEVIPGIRNTDPDLLVIYGRVARTGNPERFEMFVKALQMWFSISVYCPAPEHFVAVFEVITVRKQAEKERMTNERRMTSLYEISQYPFTGEQEFLDHALGEVISLTDSTFGYIYFYNEQTRLFTLNTWSPGVMRQCSVQDQKTVYDLDSTGIWGEAVRQRKPILLNNFQAHHQLKKGYPEGHVDLLRFLTVPIIVDEAIVAVVGVANKEDDYTDSDVMQLKLFMDSVWMITLRKQNEEALRESEEKHRSILQTAIDGFWLVDKEGSLLEVNDSYCRMSGYSKQELLAMRISDLESKETAAESAAHMQKIIERGEDRFESRHRCKNGHIIDVEVNVQFRPSEGGHFVVFVRDISVRKRAVEALRESEYFFRESQRAAFIGSYKADLIAGTWESSEVLDTIFGIDENYNRNIQGWLDLVHPDDRNMIFQYLNEEVIAKGERFSKEYRIIRNSDGETRWVHGSGEFNLDCGGNTISLIGTIRDITDSKLAFEQLENISRRLQLATASANLGVWDWNVRDNRMEWDDRMFELYGITRETFPDSIDAWLNGLHPEDREAAVAACQAALNGERVFDTTFRVCYPDGTVKHIKANGLVLRGKEGTAERMIGVNADITEKKLAEQERAKLEVQLRQAQKMESIGRLAGGVAHDFNNMLTIIFGHVQLALMDANLTPPLHASLEEIRNAAERSADLTRQLLAFARKQIIAPMALDLNETVGGMLNMLQRLIGEDIRLTWKPSANLWPVKMDPSQIDQILANLCINARDAIADVGMITIETENSVFDEEYCATHLGSLPGEYARLAVSDNGCGMDKETISKIFEPFFTTKGIGEGTGLGLATVFGIVKQNNGFINVYSEPNQGSTFTIYLPRHEGTSAQIDLHGTIEPPSCGHETILLVEDEPAILKITSLMLEMQGYTVLTASTPDEAIRLAGEYAGKIHLLMTDVIMPGMNGRDLAKQLLTGFPHMKHLFMSGYTANVIAHHGVLDEGVNFIQKPFSLPALANKVREILDNK